MTSQSVSPVECDSLCSAMRLAGALLLLLAPALAVGLRVLAVYPLPAHSHFAMFKVRRPSVAFNHTYANDELR